jgi:hypothetical protein
MLLAVSLENSKQEEITKTIQSINRGRSFMNSLDSKP